MSRIDLGCDLQGFRDSAHLDEGSYIVKVVGFREMEKKKKDAKNEAETGRTFIVDFEVQDGERKGAVHPEFYQFHANFGKQRFAQLFFCLHPDLGKEKKVTGFEPEEAIIGRTLIIDIGIRKYTDNDGNKVEQAQIKNEGYSVYKPKKAKADKPATKDEDDDGDDGDDSKKKNEGKENPSAKDDDDGDGDDKKKPAKSDDDDGDDGDDSGKKAKAKGDDDGDDGDEDGPKPNKATKGKGKGKGKEDEEDYS